MAFSFHALTTKHGFKLDEVSSAMQKEIRRGNEKEAVHWALELIESGYARYMFKRLKICAAEDIGMADPFSMVLVKQIEESWEKEKRSKAEGGEADRHYFTLAVIYLARCPKNREINDCIAYVEHERAIGQVPEIPDYAIDGHTSRGREMGKDKIKEWWNSGRVVANATGDNKYFDKMYEVQGKDAIDGYGENDWLKKEQKRLKQVRETR